MLPYQHLGDLMAISRKGKFIDGRAEQGLAVGAATVDETIEGKEG